MNETNLNEASSVAKQDGMVIRVKYDAFYKEFSFKRESDCCCDKRPADSLRDLLYPIPRMGLHLANPQCMEKYYFYGRPCDVCINCSYCNKPVRYIDENGETYESSYEFCRAKKEAENATTGGENHE
jgi:hypothetical protein